MSLRILQKDFKYVNWVFHMWIVSEGHKATNWRCHWYWWRNWNNSQVYSIGLQLQKICLYGCEWYSVYCHFLWLILDNWLGQFSSADDARFTYECINEEAMILESSKFDLALSYNSNHWIDDIEREKVGAELYWLSIGYFRAVRNSLKTDSPFLGCTIGQDTLFELRSCLQTAQQTIENGISPRIYPMIDPSGLSTALGNAGFKLITCTKTYWWYTLKFG